MSFFDKIKRLFGAPAGNGDGAPAGDPDDCPSTGSDAATEEMIPCEEALRLVHEYLDGELGDVPESKVRRHFEACGRCYPHLRLERSYREAVRRATAGQAASPELKAKVSQLLAEARAED